LAIDLINKKMAIKIPHLGSCCEDSVAAIFGFGFGSSPVYSRI
jgi:hypothetical protein